MTSEARSLPRILSAVLAVLLALAMVVLSNWADVREREIIGPVAAKAGPEGQVFVVSHGALWVLNRRGSLSASVPLEALGIDGRVSDALPMRGGEILIAERGPGLLHRCRLGDRVCVPFTTDARGTRLEGSFELAADDDRSHVYLTHTTRHAIHLFDGSGNWLATSDAAGLYEFPHRAVVVAGALYIADTNHHRLVAIEREPARFGEKVDSFSTQTSLGSRGRVYPIAHRRLPDGAWWVVNGDSRLQYADIIVFNNSGQALRRLDLPVDASPVALEVVDDLVLAPDPTNLRVDAFTLTGQSVGEFGDAAFRGELTRVRTLKGTYRRLRYGSWAALGVLLLVLVAIRLGAIRSRQRRTWWWLLGAALLALVSLSALGLVGLWAMGALYEDLIALMVVCCAVVVAVPAVVFGILMAWYPPPPGGGAGTARGRSGR
jgi:hypothetical protein